MIVSFGPLRYRVHAPGVPDALARFVDDTPGDARDVTVREGAADVAPTGNGFALDARPDGDVVTLLHARTPAAGWVAAFAELVTRDAPARGALVLHAGAVRVARGVVALIGPPGVGKTTAVRRAGDRAFAGGALLAALDDATVRVRALPFAGDPTPELDARDAATLRAALTVVRGASPAVEWHQGFAATTGLMGCVVRPRGLDPNARARGDLTLRLTGVIPWGRLCTPETTGYLPALDAALETVGEPLR